MIKINNNTKLSDIHLDYSIFNPNISYIEKNKKRRKKIKLEDLNLFSIGELATGSKDCTFEISESKLEKYNYCKIKNDDTFSTIEGKIILNYSKYKFGKYFDLEQGEILNCGIDYLFTYLYTLSGMNLVKLFNNFLIRRGVQNMLYSPNMYKAEEKMKKKLEWMNHEIPWKLTYLLFNFKRTGYMEFDLLNIKNQDRCEEIFDYLTDEEHIFD